MTGTKGNIIKGFPFPVLSKLVGEPAFDDMKEMRRKLDNNAGSVPTTLGRGAHGYLALTTPGNAYFALTGSIFNPPNNPGPQLKIPSNATSAQIGHLEQTHKDVKIFYQAYVAVGNVLKQHLLRAVDKTYI